MSHERVVSPEKILKMHATGRKRAMSGRPLVVEAVREIKDTERVKEYLFGYMSFVEEALADIGISGPDDIGIHESFQHILVKSPDLEGTSGIYGLCDGMSLKPLDDVYGDPGESAWNHYQDGHKIGVAFARANIRKGNFEAIAPFESIKRAQRDIIEPEIKKWLENNGITKYDPEIVLSLNPLVRLAFAYCISQGNGDFAEYSKNLFKKLDENTSYSGTEKEKIKSGINRAPSLAERVRATSS